VLAGAIPVGDFRYCGGLLKLHHANSELAKKALNIRHMTRAGFVKLYRTVFDMDLPQQAASELKTAEETRDAIMHRGQGIGGDAS
jgi:hypothetical protein